MLGRFTLALFAISSLLTGARAADYPERPVHVLVGYAAGSGPDIQARLISHALSEILHQTFVVENRTGANGTIAARAVATATPDGYTLLFSSSSITPTPYIYKSLGYDVLKDLKPIATSGELDGLFMLVDAKSQIKTLPEFVAQHPMYERVGLRDLCQQIHSVYRANDIARLTTEMYLSSMEPAMKPSDAFAKLAHREIDRVPVDELEGRVTSILLTPYPPGIPLLIPGERFNRTIVNYLKFAREFNERFPGFHTDIHGLVGETINGRIEYFVDCVRA